MTTIRLVDAGDDDAGAQALERVVSERGRSAHFYQMYANSPATFDAMCSLVWTMWSAREVDRATIELTILRVSQLVGSEYEWTHHRGMAADAGVGEEQIMALLHWQHADCFDERERALLATVDAAVTDVRIPTDIIEKLQSYFTDAQVIDLMTVIGMYRGIGQMLVGFQVGFEDWAPRVSDEWRQMMAAWA